MKVHSHALEAYSNSTIARSAEVRPAGKEPSQQVHKPDMAEAAYLSISTEARELAAPKESPVNTEKVAALRAKIEQGEFQVDAQKIAERILDRLA